MEMQTHHANAFALKCEAGRKRQVWHDVEENSSFSGEVKSIALFANLQMTFPLKCEAGMKWQVE